MNMQKPMNHDDDGDDQDIRELMRESAYEGRPRDEFKRDLLRELNHNFAYHRMRTRLLVAALVIVGSLAAVMRVTDVGSDGFGLFPTGTKTEFGPILEAPFAQDRFNPVSGAVNPDQQVQATQDVFEQIAAGEAKLVRVTGWTVDDKNSFTADIRVLVDGRTGLLHRRLQDPTPDHSRVLAAFLVTHEKSFLDGVENGDIPQAGLETIEVFGQVLSMTKWTQTVPSFGSVTYWRGVPEAAD